MSCFSVLQYSETAAVKSRCPKHLILAGGSDAPQYCTNHFTAHCFQIQTYCTQFFQSDMHMAHVLNRNVLYILDQGLHKMEYFCCFSQYSVELCIFLLFFVMFVQTNLMSECVQKLFYTSFKKKRTLQRSYWSTVYLNKGVHK